MTKNQLKTNVIDFINELETIFSGIREKNVDDSVCGLCEYDCDHGLDGYANECPGFEKDDCFKLKEEYRNEWINKIIGIEALEQQPCYNPDEWCRTCSEYDHDKHCCPRYNKVIRDTVEEMKQPKIHWISYWDEEARCYVYKCPECGNKQPFDTKHCWECGARMIDVPDINVGKLSEIPTDSESEE